MTEAANGANGTALTPGARRRARKKTAQPPKARAPRQAERWIPIDDLTLATVTRVRAEVQKRTKMRPDLSMVIAAMLLFLFGQLAVQLLRDDVLDAVQVGIAPVAVEQRALRELLVDLPAVVVGLHLPGHVAAVEVESVKVRVERFDRGAVLERCSARIQRPRLDRLLRARSGHVGRRVAISARGQQGCHDESRQGEARSAHQGLHGSRATGVEHFVFPQACALPRGRHA